MAIEPLGDVYNVMRVAYPASFLAMLAEGADRGTVSMEGLMVGLVVFAAAKLVKWSAILTLGRSWTFRVIVVPVDARVTRGPYR